MDLESIIRDVPDFPRPGILFKDITPLLRDGSAFRQSVQAMIEPFRQERVDIVVGLESRGFIFGAPVAYALGTGLVPIRKFGRLPADKIHVEYDLEYGHAAFEIHTDAIRPGQRVLLVDDLLATGGTSRAAIDLVERLGGVVVGCSYLVELCFLAGRERLGGYRVNAVVQYR